MATAIRDDCRPSTSGGLLLRLLRRRPLRLGALGGIAAVGGDGLGCLGLVGGLLRLRARGFLLLADPELLADLPLDLGGELRVVAQELLGVVASLPEPGFAVGEER